MILNGFFFGLLGDELGIEQHHSFVHDFQVPRHLVEVVLEFTYQMLDLVGLDLDNETVGQREMLGRDDQVVVLTQKHLDIVAPIAQVVVATVQRFLLNDLVDLVLIMLLARADGRARVRIPFFLVEVDSSGVTGLLLANYEVSLAESAAPVDLVLDERVLADVLEHPAPVLFVFLPLLHVVTGLLVLQPFENLLVFSGDPDQFSFASLSVERPAVRNGRSGLNSAHAFLGL